MASDSEDELGALDLTSRKFDALKALYSKNVRLPIPKAPVLDNIHKYRSALDHRAKKQSAKVDKDSEPGPSSEHPKRRFLPHQLPVRNPHPQQSAKVDKDSEPGPSSEHPKRHFVPHQRKYQ